MAEALSSVIPGAPPIVRSDEVVYAHLVKLAPHILNSPLAEEILQTQTLLVEQALQAAGFQIRTTQRDWAPMSFEGPELAMRLIERVFDDPTGEHELTLAVMFQVALEAPWGGAVRLRCVVFDDNTESLNRDFLCDVLVHTSPTLGNLATVQDLYEAVAESSSSSFASVTDEQLGQAALMLVERLTEVLGTDRPLTFH